MTILRTNRFALLLIVGVTINAASVFAATDSVVGKTPIHRTLSEPASSADLKSTSTGGTTLVFLGLLLAGAIIVRRVVQQRTQRRGSKSAGTVTLLGRQQVDGELTVRLLQIGPRVLVVGSSAQGLATLAELTDPEEIAALIGEPVSQKPLFDGRSPVEVHSNESSSVPSQRRTSRLPATTQVGG